MNLRLITVCALLLVTGAYIHLAKPQPTFLESPLSSFPVKIGDWKMVYEDHFSAEILAILRPTDYLSRHYKDPAGNIVSLYMGYHGGREGDGGIHSPKNCLPGSGWFLDEERKVGVEVENPKPIEVVNTVMSKGPETISFYYWFQVQGQVYSDEYSLKIAEVWNSFVERRKDASFIRISMPVKDNGVAVDDVMYKFIQDFYPAISGFLPS